MKKIFFASGENKKAMAKVHNKELKTLIWLIIKKIILPSRCLYVVIRTPNKVTSSACSAKC